MWYTIDKLVATQGWSRRHIYRLVKLGKLKTMTGDDGEKLIWLDEKTQLSFEAVPAFETVEIPVVGADKITDGVLAKAKALTRLLEAKNVVATEAEIEHELGIARRTQQRYKSELRSLFKLPARYPLSLLVKHPQLRQAIEYVLTRKSPATKGTMRKARRLIVLKSEHGEYCSLEDFLLSLYSRPGGITAVDVNTTMRNLCTAGQILTESEEKKLIPCSLEVLPSYAALNRFLRKREQEKLAVRRARMATKKDWDAFNVYVKRDPKEYRVRGKLEGDHTEIDVEVINSRTGKPDRLWVTSMVDYHSSLAAGYYLSYRPNSETIALCGRNAMTGAQIQVATPEGPKPIENFMDVPDIVLIDNGKDYRSKYTQHSFGKIDFDDDARRTIQRICELHYAEKYHPQSKPHVERSFGVLNELWKLLPGYKSSNYQKKTDQFKEEQRQNQLFFDYQFAQLFHQAFYQYNNRPRRRLGGLSIIQYVLANQQHRRVVDDRVLDFLLMKPSKHRQIRRGYVTLHGKEYFSFDLQAHNDKFCTIYYDPQEMGYAHVYLEREFITTAVHTDLIGKTERELLEVIKERKRRDKAIHTEIKELHQGISNLQAKGMLWNGMMGNVSFVTPEQLAKTTPAINIMTGIEQQAKEVAEELKAREEIAEQEKEAKKRQKHSPIITLSRVRNL